MTPQDTQMYSGALGGYAVPLLNIEIDTAAELNALEREEAEAAWREEWYDAMATVGAGGVA